MMVLGGVSQAGVILNVTSMGSPAVGLEAFKVTAVGTEGEDVASIASLSLTGAHQVWENAIASTKSTLAGDLSAGTFGNAAWEAFDSHLLLDSSLHINSPGFGVDETNDGSDPTGLSPLTPANPAFAAFTGVAGLGDLFFTGVAAQVTLTPFEASVDLLYVVVEAGQAALLDVTFVDGSASGFIDFTGVEVGVVPEPASIVLIGLGGLLACTRRRNA